MGPLEIVRQPKAYSLRSAWRAGATPCADPARARGTGNGPGGTGIKQVAHSFRVSEGAIKQRLKNGRDKLYAANATKRRS